jgi:hypothetical protein
LDQQQSPAAWHSPAAWKLLGHTPLERNPAGQPSDCRRRVVAWRSGTFPSCRTSIAPCCELHRNRWGTLEPKLCLTTSSFA